MSRKPETPRTDDSPAGMDRATKDIPAGPRYSSSKEILELEAELVADGVDLGNRAIPAEYHPETRTYSDADAIREEIEAELDTDHPNRSLIGLLNEQLAEVET